LAFCSYDETHSFIIEQFLHLCTCPIFPGQLFSLPLGGWLQAGPWRTLFHDVLLGSNSNLFDRREIEKLLAGQIKGRANSERLFALVLFELWRKEYGVTL
jgi:asparagine synthase (glutamine-hydrolysing)